MSEQAILRRIQPLPLPAAMKAPVVGARPKLRWVAPTDLLVDATYQRDLSERSMRLIGKMCGGFAWNRMKPPIVVEVGPASLHVVDGQHTAIAAATLGIKEIPVFVVEATTQDERARSFVAHNTDRVIVSPFDIYHALLAAGDPDAVDVDRVCKRAGVRIRVLSPSSAIAEGDCAAVGAIRRLVQRRGVQKARMILEALVRAKRAPIGQAEILAVETIVCERPNVDLDNLAAAVRIEGSKGLAQAHARAKAERAPIWRCLMDRYLARLKKEAPIA